MRALALLALAGCGPDIERPNGLIPAIDSFTAVPMVVEPMQEAVLFWDTTNVSAVDIGPDIARNLDADGSFVVRPEWSMVYLLTAKGEGALTQSQIVVEVRPTTMPFVHLFYAEPSRVTAGEPTTLSWVVSDATTIFVMDMQGGQLYFGPELESAVEVVPVATTPAPSALYHLAAMDEYGQFAEGFVEVPID